MSEMCLVHDRPYTSSRGMANGVVALHCSWDGSLHPDVFMNYLKQPGTILTPTDKDYKVYISVLASEAGDDPHEVKPMVMGSGDPAASGYKDARRPNRKQRKWMRDNGYGYSADKKDGWVVWGERGDRRDDKFYFVHLEREQRKEFVRMLNDGELTLAEPGYFYRLPLFIAR